MTDEKSPPRDPRDLLRRTVAEFPTFGAREIRAVMAKRLLEPGNRGLLHAVIEQWLERNYFPAAYRRGAAVIPSEQKKPRA